MEEDNPLNIIIADIDTVWGTMRVTKFLPRKAIGTLAGSYRGDKYRPAIVQPTYEARMIDGVFEHKGVMRTDSARTVALRLLKDMGEWNCSRCLKENSLRLGA